VHVRRYRRGAPSACLVGISALALAAGCTDTYKAPPGVCRADPGGSGWFEFTAGDDAFRVLLIASSKEQGGEVHQVSAQRGKQSMQVLIKVEADLRDPTDRAAKIARAYQTTADLFNSKGNHVRSADDALTPSGPGKRIVWQTKNDLSVVTLLFVVRDRLYALNAFAAPDQPLPADEVERFFASFQVPTRLLPLTPCPAGELAACEAWCARGNARSCHAAASTHRESKEPSEKTRAVALYRQACADRLPEGCFFAADMIETGEGVERDLPGAVALYKQACDIGSADGCNNLGDCYENGRGVAQNDVTAVALYRKSCDEGSAGGCGSLGTMLERGRGVPADRAAAIDRYRYSCHGGFAASCAHLRRLGEAP
jgi:TPR repeat protein